MRMRAGLTADRAAMSAACGLVMGPSGDSRMSVAWESAPDFQRIHEFFRLGDVELVGGLHPHGGGVGL